jgi:hypothetical protein
MTFDNTDKGILFQNKDRSKDTDPHYRGNLNIGGTEYWLTGWKKDTNAGPALSLSIRPKKRTPGETPQRP